MPVGGRLAIAAIQLFALSLGSVHMAVAQSAPIHVLNMAEAAEALRQAGSAMIAHGQAMLDEGQGTGDLDLASHGDHWLQDGRLLIERGRWLTTNPIAPGSLVTPPAQLSAQDAWGALPRAAEAMIHDPSNAREVDLEALRWNGEAMLAEGRNMVDHGRLMVEEVDVFTGRHPLDPQTAEELRLAAKTLQRVGRQLEQNGQDMIEYAERLRRSLGIP